MRHTKWIRPDSNCSLHPHAEEYDVAVFGSGRGSPPRGGTLVLSEPFSIRLQSSVKGYTPFPSFFSMPEKYMFAALINSSRDARSADGIDSRNKWLGVPSRSKLTPAPVKAGAAAAAPPTAPRPGFWGTV